MNSMHHTPSIAFQHLAPNSATAEQNTSGETCSSMRRNTRKQQCTSTFDRKCLLRVKKRQVTKEEGSKEEYTQEGASLFLFFFFFFFLDQLLRVCPLICLLLLLLSVCLLAPEEDNFCQKCLFTIVCLGFVALVSTFHQICFILSNSPAVVVSTFPQICFILSTGLNLKAIDNVPKMVAMDRGYTKVRAEPRA